MLTSIFLALLRLGKGEQNRASKENMSQRFMTHHYGLNTAHAVFFNGILTPAVNPNKIDVELTPL